MRTIASRATIHRVWFHFPVGTQRIKLLSRSVSTGPSTSVIMSGRYPLCCLKDLRGSCDAAGDDDDGGGGDDDLFPQSSSSYDEFKDRRRLARIIRILEKSAEGSFTSQVSSPTDLLQTVSELII